MLRDKALLRWGCSLPPHLSNELSSCRAARDASAIGQANSFRHAVSCSSLAAFFTFSVLHQVAQAWRSVVLNLKGPVCRELDRSWRSTKGVQHVLLTIIASKACPRGLLKPSKVTAKTALPIRPRTERKQSASLAAEPTGGRLPAHQEMTGPPFFVTGSVLKPG